MKVLTSVITFNRIKLLERCINNIEKQTRKTDDILIVNNSSSDGTSEFLKLNSYKFITQKNTGSAGGWHTAIEYAIKHNFDYIWLMDDDGYPDNYSLEKLTKNMKNEYSCLSSIVINENNHSDLVFPFPKLNKNKLPSLLAFPRKKKSIKEFNSIEISKNLYEFCHLFNGALISIKHIKKIGNINIKYFMYGDEVDYYFRLKKVGKVFSLLDSFHYHPNVSKRELSKLKVYYYIKNSIILNYKYFDYPLIRSIFNILVGILRFIVRNNFKSNFYFLLSFKFKFIILAIVRGFKGIIDIDYEK